MSAIAPHPASPERLGGVVFKCTPRGAEVLLQAGAELPGPLRTLLLAVDGRSPASHYARALRALAPLSEKFEQLQALGCVSVRGQPVATQNPADITLSPAPEHAGESSLAQLADSLMQQQRESMPPGVQEAFLLADSLSAGLASLQSEPWAVAGNNTDGAAFASQAGQQDQPSPQNKAVSTEAQQLAVITANVQQFLTQEAGMEGLPVVLMLEQIRSIAQFRLELPDYLALIEPFGLPAQAHAVVLAALLDQAA